MKASLPLLVVLLAAPGVALGQGYVSFTNNTSTRFSTNTPGSLPGSGFSAAVASPIGSYYFALFAAPSTQNTISTSTDPTLNGWSFVALGTNTTLAGRLSGNFFDSGQAAQIPGFAATTVADFAVAGWTANIGTSWALAQAWWANGVPTQVDFQPRWFGINPTVANDIVLGSFGGPYPSPFGSSAGFLNGWGLSSYGGIPEPSSFALMSVGTAIMIYSRRRRTRGEAPSSKPQAPEKLQAPNTNFPAADRL